MRAIILLLISLATVSYCVVDTASESLRAMQERTLRASDIN